MEEVFKTLNLSDNNKIFRCITMTELHNALKFITILFLFKIYQGFNLGVAFLKSVNIVKLGFTGIYIIFLIFSLKPGLRVLVRTAFMRRF